MPWPASVAIDCSGHVMIQQAAADGSRLLALFTLELDANENFANFPIIYTMGPISNNELQPHDVRSGLISPAL